MSEPLATIQTLRYAEELRELHGAERAQRRRAEDALAELGDSYGLTVRALAATLELRDDVTGSHAERVTAVALELARLVAPELAADPALEYGFLLHDLGKIGVRDAVLLKPSPLDAAELEEMRRHPVLGAEIVARIPYLSGVARDVVLAHHERWDGTGYPRGTAGEEIPLAARIFSIADAFDAITNDRPYQRARSADEALAEVARAAGTQFDPALVSSFVVLISSSRRA